MAKDEAKEAVAAASASPLPLYLREMGVTPLLTEDRELELTQQFEQSRAKLEQLMLQLPHSYRKRLRIDPESLKRRRRIVSWQYEQIDALYHELLVFADANPDDRVVRLRKQASRAFRDMSYARDQMILANLRLVVHTAKKYLNNGIAFLDLIQEGNIGLMKAVDKFESERGNKFATYAFWWIKQAMDRVIADQARIIRIPVYQLERQKKVNRFQKDFFELHRRFPTVKEIAKALSMKKVKVEEALGLVKDPESLDTLGDEKLDPIKFTADPNETDPTTRLDDRERREKVREALAYLSDREADIVRYRFGLEGRPQLTLEAVGRAMGLSRERVRQLEATAFKKINSLPNAGDLRRLMEL